MREVILDQKLILFETEQKENFVIGSNVVKYEPQICIRKCIFCSILVFVHSEVFHPTENQFITCINVNYPSVVLERPEFP